MEQETNHKNEKMRKYILLAILFVVGLIGLGVTITYAYFKVSTSYDSTLGNVSGSLECVNISYSETDTIDLDYNYPISDEYALNNITPVTVSVTNNCSSNVNAVNYALTLTTLNNGSNFIEDSKIRTNIKRKIGTDSETTLKNTSYLNSLTPLTSGNAYTYLTEDLQTRANVSTYTNKISYTIDNNSIANGKTNTYKVYLWVDYYEGDSNMYSGTNPVHDESYDNSTENKNFAAAISLIVNP